MGGVSCDWRRGSRGALERRVAEICRASLPGSVIVQVRDRDRPASERLALSRVLVAVGIEHSQRVLVNDRCDIARLADAAGVHLGEDGISRKGNAALGLAALTRARARLAHLRRRVCLYALGGVTAETAATCLEAGANGVAVIGAALVADPAPLLDALEIRRG